LELQPGTRTQVAGAESHGDVIGSGEPVEQRRHTRKDLEAGGAGELVGEQGDVVVEDGRDQRRPGRPSELLEPCPYDPRIGHAVEPHVAERRRGAAVRFEGALERAPAGAGGGEQRTVDVEEKDRGLHWRRGVRPGPGGCWGAVGGTAAGTIAGPGCSRQGAGSEPAPGRGEKRGRRSRSGTYRAACR